MVSRPTGFESFQTIYPLTITWINGKKWCRGRDSNPRTTKDWTLNPAPLTRLSYPCVYLRIGFKAGVVYLVNGALNEVQVMRLWPVVYNRPLPSTIFPKEKGLERAELPLHGFAEFFPMISVSTQFRINRVSDIIIPSGLAVIGQVI